MVLKREFFLTADGSTSIHLPEWDEQYHSKHGAIREAEHIFIKNGWDYFSSQQKGFSFSEEEPFRILEFGFGTGLNAFLTFLKAQEEKIKIEYTAVEAFPLSISEISRLNYTSLLPTVYEDVFSKFHELPWNQKQAVSDYFTLKKKKEKFEDFSSDKKFHLIYFDAFSPRVQPELWTERIFEKIHALLHKGGVLTTYCAKGSVRRAMQSVGFEVERLPGPPGKREMLRAKKSAEHSA